MEWRSVKYNSTNNIPPPVYGHCISLIRKDKLLLFGGYGSSSVVNDQNLEPLSLQIWEYSIEKKEWSLKEYSCKEDFNTLMKNQLSDKNQRVPKETIGGHSLQLVAGKLFCYGGFVSEKGSSNDLFLFDSQDKSWYQNSQIHMKDVPPPSFDHKTVVYKGSVVLVIGGWDLENYFRDVHMIKVREFRSLRLVDYSNENFEIEELPKKEEQEKNQTKKKSTLQNSEKNQKFKSKQQEQLLNYQWEKTTPTGITPVLRGFSATIHKNMVFVFGGIKKNSQKFSNDIWILHINDSGEKLVCIWNKLDDVKGEKPSPRAYHSACIIDTKLIIFGGIGERNQCLNDLYIFNLQKMVWKKCNIFGYVLPSPRYHHTFTKINDQKLIIFGGKGSNGKALNDMFELVVLRW
ncbi:kelch repeat domain [Anaeramoeba flamelloides]|uniref:Kelch repeat domain n=1 Tax=Anaeramoeba flamelloides TaxID=1746091 RepID=A0AAV7ZPV5_9EUKA|nr:kelch repeat domain [Anaeramoeba flamelloides]